MYSKYTIYICNFNDIYMWLLNVKYLISYREKNLNVMYKKWDLHFWKKCNINDKTQVWTLIKFPGPMTN